MVMVSNLPTLPSPVVPATDIVIVTRDNQLQKLTVQDLFASSGLSVDPGTINHDLLLTLPITAHRPPIAD